MVKYGVAGRVMGALVMERKLAGMLAEVLVGAQTHLETWRIVGQGGELIEPERAEA